MKMRGVEISGLGPATPPPQSLACSTCSLLSSRVGAGSGDLLLGQLDPQNVIVFLIPGIATLILSLRLDKHTVGRVHSNLDFRMKVLRRLFM
jgi:hypothetical protein